MQPSSLSPTGSAFLTRAARPPAETEASARALAAQFESLLLGEIFRPLATSLGFFGDAVTRQAAQAIALHESGGLTDALARAIAERDP